MQAVQIRLERCQLALSEQGNPPPGSHVLLSSGCIASPIKEEDDKAGSSQFLARRRMLLSMDLEGVPGAEAEASLILTFLAEVAVASSLTMDMI